MVSGCKLVVHIACSVEVWLPTKELPSGGEVIITTIHKRVVGIIIIIGLDGINHNLGAHPSSLSW